jgi:hypothetical protein
VDIVILKKHTASVFSVEGRIIVIFAVNHIWGKRMENERGYFIVPKMHFIMMQARFFIVKM